MELFEEKVEIKIRENTIFAKIGEKNPGWKSSSFSIVIILAIPIREISIRFFSIFQWKTFAIWK